MKQCGLFPRPRKIDMSKQFHDRVTYLLSSAYPRTERIHHPILSMNFIGNRLVYILLEENLVIRSWNRMSIIIDSEKDGNISEYHLNTAASQLYKAISHHVYPIIQKHKESLIIVINRQRYRGPSGMILYKALPSAFLEAQLYSTLMGFIPENSIKIASICQNILSNYLEIPLFGQDKKRVVKDILRQRMTLLADIKDPTTLSDENKIRFLLKNGEKLKSTDMDDIGIAVIQALVWKEWQGNIIYWFNILKERSKIADINE